MNHTVIIRTLSWDHSSGLVVLVAYDMAGRSLFFAETVWAGVTLFSIDLVDAATNAPKTGPVSVTVVLADDSKVQATATTADGTVSIPNIPSRTIIISAVGDDGSIGSGAAVGI